MPACYIQDLTHKDVNYIKSLLESSKHGLLGTENEMRCYEELVSVEKEINMAVLFKIKQNTFTQNLQNQQANIFLQLLPASFQLPMF